MSSVTIHTRAFHFGVAVLQLARSLERSRIGGNLSSQLVRAGTSIGANIIEAQNASSRKEFIRYLQIALRSARETKYWLDPLDQSRMSNGQEIERLRSECREIGMIIASIVLRAKSNSLRLSPPI